MGRGRVKYGFLGLRRQLRCQAEGKNAALSILESSLSFCAIAERSGKCLLEENISVKINTFAAGQVIILFKKRSYVVSKKN
jgi:hypothetical protein